MTVSKIIIMINHIYIENFPLNSGLIISLPTPSPLPKKIYTYNDIIKLFYHKKQTQQQQQQRQQTFNKILIK